MNKAKAAPELASKIGGQLEQAESIIAKKAEGKVVTPEEYSALGKLVDTYEKLQSQGKQAVRAEKAQKVAAIKATINPEAYKIKLQDAGLPEKITKLLQESDYDNVGRVMEQLAIDEDRILGLEGFGPKLLDELKASLDAIKFPEPPVEVKPTPAAAAATEKPDVEPGAEVLAAEAASADGVKPAVVLDENGDEVEQSFEELIGEEDEEEDGGKGDKKKVKKKGKVGTKREVVFDEDLGMFVAKIKRKPGRSKDWTEDIPE